MSTNSNTGDQSLIFNGLGTFVTIITAAGDYVVQGQLKIPVPTGSGPSSVVSVVKLNASTEYTGNAGATGFRVLVPGVAVGDTISVITSSSAPVDQGLNIVQTQVQIYQGDI